MSTESQKDSEFDSLSVLMSTTCEACGARNALRASKCEECGAAIKQKEGEEKSLSFLHAEGLDRVPTAMSSSHKLRRLQLALAGIRRKEISLELYHAVVEQVLRESQAMQEILEMQVLQQAEAKLDAQAIDILGDAADHVDAFCQACERMLRYDGTNNLQEAEDGFSLAHSTIIHMEETQREAKNLEEGS